MKHIRRLMFRILGPVLAVIVTASPAPRALAAGTVIYVDDYAANNGTTKCPETPYDNISAGVVAAGLENATVYVCEGIYTFGGVVIDQASNFKLMAKGEVVLKPTAAFTGDFLAVTSSDNVTIQGFIIDANRGLGDGSATAIRFQSTSGSILKNSILGWREEFLIGSNGSQIAISVFASTDDKIKIDHNTIYDFQRTGISVDNVGPATISHNLVVASSSGNSYGMTGINLNRLTSGTISANTIRSDAGLMDTAIQSNGIRLSSSSGLTIKGNTIEGLRTGIFVTSTCLNAPTTNNMITKNKILNPDYTGVWVHANWTGACPSLGLDHITITSNTITSTGHSATNAVRLSTQNDGLVDSTTIKNNKFYGYSSNIVGLSGTITNTDASPNKTYHYSVPGI
jgi:hypothetical protein